MAIKPFEFERDRKGALNHRLGIARRLQPRFARNRRGKRHRLRRILRHQLAELVDLPVRHFQHAADVAQHAARLQGAEGDDLCDLVAAVFFLHVMDHLVAAVLTEIDVEVRHRYAFRIEKALEQQAQTGLDRGR